MGSGAGNKRRYVRAAVIAMGSGAGDKRRAFGRDARSSNSGGRAAPASASVVTDMS